MTAQGAPIRLLAQVMARLRASAAGRLADVHACRGIPHPYHAWGADQHATAVAIQTRRQTTQAARKDATSEGGEDDELKITRKRVSELCEGPRALHIAARQAASA